MAAFATTVHGHPPEAGLPTAHAIAFENDEKTLPFKGRAWVGMGLPCLIGRKRRNAPRLQ
jgi:hypothetical protein